MFTLLFSILSLGTYGIIFYYALKDMNGLKNNERSEQIR